MITEPVHIGNCVWVAARATILNGCVLQDRCVIAAGSVVRPHEVCEENTIYSGVPAVKLKQRGLVVGVQQPIWKPFFR
ncbi:MAG: hypothetical protein LBU32_16155 [Clostridiales bacterium]|nr:hypothetical protein [Clostridiales bacterium]